MKWWRGGTMASLLTVCESESSFFFFKQHFATITLWCWKLQSHKCFLQSPVVWSVCFLHNGPVFRWKWRQNNTGDGTNADWSKWEIMHHPPLGGSTIKAHQTAAGTLHILRSKEMIMSEGGPKQRHVFPQIWLKNWISSHVKAPKQFSYEIVSAGKSPTG